MKTQTLAGKRILVVEDDWFQAKEIARAIVALEGAVIGPAATREEALTLLGREEPDFAVLDIDLGGEMVFPVAIALDRTGIPYVFASGYGGTLVLPKEFASIPRWSKPYDPRTLVEAIPRA